MVSKLVQAAWRQETEKARGTLKPELLEPKLWQQLKNRKIRHFVVATCNFEYLLEHEHCLRAYEESPATIPLLCGVYCLPGKQSELRAKLNVVSSKLQLKKVILFIFQSTGLAWIQKNQSDPEIRWDYLINYIRCARYTLIRSIWDAIGLQGLELSLHQSSTYVIDLDNIVKADFDAVIKSLYGLKKMIFSWNSGQSPSMDFPATLSGLVVEKSKDGNLSWSTNHPYKIIKAGFTALAPSSVSNIYLNLLELYSIGDDKSVYFIRLFTFYFSDQMAMLLALGDLKQAMPYRFCSDLQWIDIKYSKIVNLDAHKAGYIWYPKGVGINVAASKLS
jgi:hypothetical protein